MRSRYLIWWAAGFGALLTAIVTFVPSVPFVYGNKSLQISLETTVVLVAFLSALIFYGRFQQRGAIQDLAVVYVLIILGFTTLVFGAVPALLKLDREATFLAWTQAATRLLASLVLALAAIGAGRFLKDRSRSVGGFYVIGLSAFTVLVIAGLAILTEPYLPEPIQTAGPVADENQPNVQGHPVFLALQLGQMVLYAGAAYGFWKRGREDGSALTTWLAGACVLSAFARLNYFLLPTLYSEYVYVGDVLRLGFYVFLLVGGALEIRSYSGSLSAAAVTEERRRVAQDLHDGLAQELVFITAQTNRFLKRPPQARDLQRLSSAADRAVAESRRAIDALSADKPQRLDEVLKEMAQEIERRGDATVTLDADVVEVPASVKETVIRIAREAMMNALRHGRPSKIGIGLRQRGGLRLSIIDDGAGFDPPSAPSSRDGFGLISMHEKAKSFGGSLEITSAPGQGTRLSLHIPDVSEAAASK